MMDSNNQERVNPDKMKELIPAYLAGTLNERSTSSLGEHLIKCEACQAELRQLTAIWEALPDRAPQDAPLDYWPLVQSRLEKNNIVAFPQTQPRWRVALSFAAGLVAGLGFWVIGTGSPALSMAAADELTEHEFIFEYLDPIPPESMAGQYLTVLSIEDEDIEAEYER
jgi:anti-sigma factor RsiW